MKIFRIIIFVLIALAYPYYSYSAELGDIRLSLIEGDVQVYSEDTQEWIPASINMPLMEDDRVWVPEGGRAEIHIKGGTYLRLDETSSLSIFFFGEESAQFYMESGYLYVNDRRGGLNYIQVDTTLSSVSIYDGSVVMVDVSDRGYSDVSVLKSYAYVESRSGKIRVPAGRTLRVRDDLYADMSPLGSPDEWERWNRQRDNRLFTYGESSRYLPDELNEYSNDFDRNGRWVYVREYGYVWTPTIQISVGWAPYRIGRWAWVRGEYVWISYEPWGWVPYHYGRWAYISRIGWVWVPPAIGAVYWAPGYVAWVSTPTYVAWVPLAPGETYYGRGYYGPHSVNIVNINVEKTVIKHEYKNVKVKNSVTIINKETFVSGKKADIKVKDNPFLKERAHVGPPEIKPSKETHMPVIKKIHDAKRPPERIRKVDIKEIKVKRKRVKETEASVFVPDKPTEKMPVEEQKEPKKRSFKPSPEKQREMQREKKQDRSEIQQEQRAPAAPELSSKEQEPRQRSEKRGGDQPQMRGRERQETTMPSVSEPQPSMKEQSPRKKSQGRGAEPPQMRGREKQEMPSSRDPAVERQAPQKPEKAKTAEGVKEAEKSKGGNGKEKGKNRNDKEKEMKLKEMEQR